MMISFSLYFLLFLNYIFTSTVLAEYKPKLRILSGYTQDASPGQFPWVVAMDITTKGKSRFCAGNILNDKWILTTADCVKGAKSISVHPGEVKISKDKKESFVAKEWKIHKEFGKALHNNVAVVQLKDPLKFNASIKPVELSYNRLEDYSVVTVIGWGLSVKSAFKYESPNLHYLKVTSMPEDECENYFFEGEIFENEFCTTSGPSGNNCLSTKGAGALAYYDGKPQLVGIHSFVRPGCKLDYPMGFIRVLDFLPWIKNITKV